ncbi:MAG: hypothetical protein IT462_02070 [Planctomycetes bacterium]|nr:hypothetical protein [Planctomycetota bacterium]
MIGFKVMTKDGLRGPFQKSSILKGIETGTVPLKAKLLDLQTNRMITASDLVGVELDKDNYTKTEVMDVEKTQPMPPKSKTAKATVEKVEGKAMRLDKTEASPKLPPMNIRPAKLPLKPVKAKAAKKNAGAFAGDVTMPSPVEAGMTQGRAAGNAPKVVNDDSDEFTELAEITDLILTEDKPAKKPKK